MPAPKPTIILGIDPGTATTGWGVIKTEGSRLLPVAFGCITTPAKQAQSLRLQTIYTELTALLHRHQPVAVGVEKLFFYNNARTALSVGEARGAVLLAIQLAGIPLRECTPLQVKQAVSAYGQADKKQVQKMVAMILGLKEIPQPDDAADALAIAICCSNAIPR